MRGALQGLIHAELRKVRTRMVRLLRAFVAMDRSIWDRSTWNRSTWDRNTWDRPYAYHLDTNLLRRFLQTTTEIRP